MWKETRNMYIRTPKSSINTVNVKCQLDGYLLSTFVEYVQIKSKLNSFSNLILILQPTSEKLSFSFHENMFVRGF